MDRRNTPLPRVRGCRREELRTGSYLHSNIEPHRSLCVCVCVCDDDKFNTVYGVRANCTFSLVYFH